MPTYLIQQGQCAIRLMQDQLTDYTTLATWLTDPVVLEYYEGRDNPFPLPASSRNMHHAHRGCARSPPAFCSTPAGRLAISNTTIIPSRPRRLQSASNGDSFWDRSVHRRSHLLEPWERAIFVQLAIRYLTAVCKATHITVDPHVDNPHTIRCYEKCGFTQRKRLPQHEYHEGAYRDSWLMVYNQLPLLARDDPQMVSQRHPSGRWSYPYLCVNYSRRGRVLGRQWGRSIGGWDNGKTSHARSLSRAYDAVSLPLALAVRTPVPCCKQEASSVGASTGLVS